MTPVPEETRPRPRLHFTARSGWINDPHGVLHTGGRYHLFFQHNPAGTVWAAACHWGHATSDDLLTWREEPIALAPADGEVGCWSGSVVLDGDVPTLLYTRVAGDAWGHGQVALARGSSDLAVWVRDHRRAVVEGPPAGLDSVHFRDPFVWRAEDGWRMLVGIGLAGGEAAAVQYRSDDLMTWHDDGLLARRSRTETDGAFTGGMWECPQLFALDGAWVLIVSVWDDERLHHVAYGVGAYDGRRFTPRTWGRLSHGDQMYAATTFVDADGRRCMLSWLRERDDTTPAGSPYAGAHSLPRVLRLDGDLLVASPHPNLDRYLRPAEPAAGTSFTVPPLGDCAGLRLDTTGPATATRGRLSLTVDPAARAVVVADDGEPVLTMPLAAGDRQQLRLIVDADIVELAVAGVSGVGTARCAAQPAVPVSVRGTGTTVARLSRALPR